MRLRVGGAGWWIYSPKNLHSVSIPVWRQLPSVVTWVVKSPKEPSTLLLLLHPVPKSNRDPEMRCTFHMPLCKAFLASNHAHDPSSSNPSQSVRGGIRFFFPCYFVWFFFFFWWCLCWLAVLRNKAMSNSFGSCCHVSVGSELNVWLFATSRVAFQDTTDPISFFKDQSVVWQKLISCLHPVGQSKISSRRPN